MRNPATILASLALAMAASQGAHAQQPTVSSKPPLPPHAADVDADALQALAAMGAYLDTLKTFAIKAQTTVDVVTVDGQRLQLDADSRYVVRRPNGFVIDVKSDIKNRTFYYDGKQFTVYAPELGYYASVDAPATNVATLDAIEAKYGITLPLEDLFRWNGAEPARVKTLISGFAVGPATIDGVATEQYAFREKDIDWQIWIQKGVKPLPRKLVIIDRTDPAAPAYTARLSWSENPALTQKDFTFTPASNAKPIRLTAAR